MLVLIFIMSEVDMAFVKKLIFIHVKKTDVLPTSDWCHMFSSRLSNDWCSVPVLVGYSHYRSLIMTTVTNSNDIEREKLCLL